MGDDAWVEWLNTAHERRHIASLDFDWREEAVCKIESVPTVVFFPERKRGDVAAAQARDGYCMRCPVRLDCAQWAIDAGIEHGVFGGASPRQRQRMKQLGTPDVVDVMKKAAS